MSNCETVTLPVLEVEQHQVKELLQSILHTIIFNRALGPVVPRELDLQLFDITYVSCGDAAVERKVTEKIAQFVTWVDKHPGKRGQVVLSFFEKRRKQAWFSSQEERLFWEQWILNVAVAEHSTALDEQNSPAHSSARAQRAAKQQAALEEALAVVVRTVNERKDHIPPVVSSSTITFPFDISIAGEGGSGFGLDTMKRLLMHSSPPPVLS